jgi:probable phosphomutase (TIGR03848 family)
MATIILVRHGENDWVKKQRLAGWIPGIHLNENGRQQAEDAAQRLAHLPLKAVYSSPVERCLETADYIAHSHQLPVRQLEAVGEVRYGQWEGEEIKKLAQEKAWYIVQHYPSRHHFPDGEALREVQFRAVQALESLSHQHPKETIVVVSHADLIKLVLAHYLGTHIDLFQRIVISPASISVLALPADGKVHVLRLNDTGILTIPSSKEQSDEQAV